METLHTSTAQRTQTLASADIVKMREIAKAVYDNPALLADFERDPAAAAFKINRYVVRDGFHIHIADDQNRLYPAEEAGRFGAEGAEAWARVEIRAGYKTFSLVECA